MLGVLLLLHKAYNKVKSTLSPEPQQAQLLPCLLTAQIHELGHHGYSTNLASPQGAVFMYK